MLCFTVEGFKSSFSALLGHSRGGRKLPSLMQQANIIFYRSVVKSINEGNALLLDVFLVVVLGIILGAVQVCNLCFSFCPCLVYRYLSTFVQIFPLCVYLCAGT